MRQGLQISGALDPRSINKSSSFTDGLRERERDSAPLPRRRPNDSGISAQLPHSSSHGARVIRRVLQLDAALEDRDRLRLTRRLALLGSIAVVGALCAASFASYSHHVMQLLDQLRAQGQLRAQHFAAEVAPVLLRADTTSLETLAARLLSQRDVVYVAVHQPTGAPVLYWGPGIGERASSPAGSAIVVEGPEPYLLVAERIERPPRGLSTPGPRAPVEAKAEAPLGVAELGLSLAPLQAAIRTARWVSVLGTAAAAVLGVLLSVVLSRRLLRPLKELQELAERVEADELPTPHDPDLARIVAALHGLRLGVDDTRAEMERRQGEIETLVSEQTRELRRSEQRYRSILDQADVGLLVWDPNTLRIVEANAKVRKLIGEESAHLVDRSLDELFSKRDHRKYAEALRAISQQGTVDLTEVELEQHEQGSIPVEISSSLVRVGDETLVLGLVRDLTETRASERRDVLLNEEITRSERMASIGQLAAGVAHEINNPMSYIASNVNQLSDFAKQLADLTEQSLAPGAAMARIAQINEIVAEVQEIASDTCEGVVRVAEIVTALREFSHGGREEVGYEWVDLNRVIRNCLTLIRNEIKEKATVHLELQPLPTAYCHATQIGQVLMNLIRNAAQSMDEPGVILITSCAAGEQVHIVIEDNGRGIDPEDLPKIFDPFFTTKIVGQGTGLGLSVSHEIIRKHKGSLWVDSRVGYGTRFLIELPRDGAQEPDDSEDESSGTSEDRA